MGAHLSGNGVHFGQPNYNQSGNETDLNSYQKNAPVVIKVGFGSASTLNQSNNGGSGSGGYIDGTEVSMGVPSAPNNIYRMWYQTVSDDTSGDVSGNGFRFYRWTPSAGWQELLAQGEHASYDNNMSDWYRMNNFIAYCQVHPSYPTQEHRFRLYWEKHSSGNIRINCDIGGDQRRNNHHNNTYEVWEMDRQSFSTFGNFNPAF